MPHSGHAKAPLLGAFLFVSLFLASTALSRDAQAVDARGEFDVNISVVTDGDSAVLRDGRGLRLIGINAPEFGKDGNPDEPLAREARTALDRLVSGNRIRAQLDLEPHDRYGRLLAHLTLRDGRSVQVQLLEQGLACVIAVAPNLMNLDRYLAAEAVARRAKRGIWNEAYFAPRAAESITDDHVGFRFVRGQVQRVGESRKYIYLDLSSRLSVMIAHEDWRHYFRGQPDDYKRKSVVVRGWISRGQNDQLRIRVHHPAMINGDDPP